MKNIFCFLMPAFICLQTKAQEVTTAKWMQQPVVIDGNVGEWGELNLYDEDTKLSFAIGNDSNNIYLCFENTDQVNQMKMMRGGMKISLITKGKNKHDATIEFPLPQSKQAQMQPQFPDSGQNNLSPSYKVHNAASFRENYITTHSIMNVSGFTSINGETSINNTNSIKAAINWDSASNLFYEVAISKKEFYGADYTPSLNTGDITLNVEIGALHGADAESRTVGSANHHWQGNGGGGVHGGRQFNNQNGGAGNGEQNQSFQSQKAALTSKSSFKQKFILSSKSES